MTHSSGNKQMCFRVQCTVTNNRATLFFQEYKNCDCSPFWRRWIICSRFFLLSLYHQTCAYVCLHVLCGAVSIHSTSTQSLSSLSLHDFFFVVVAVLDCRCCWLVVVSCPGREIRSFQRNASTRTNHKAQTAQIDVLAIYIYKCSTTHSIAWMKWQNAQAVNVTHSHSPHKCQVFITESLLGTLGNNWQFWSLCMQYATSQYTRTHAYIGKWAAVRVLLTTEACFVLSHRASTSRERS